MKQETNSSFLFFYVLMLLAFLANRLSCFYMLYICSFYCMAYHWKVWCDVGIFIILLFFPIVIKDSFFTFSNMCVCVYLCRCEIANGFYNYILSSIWKLWNYMVDGLVNHIFICSRHVIVIFQIVMASTLFTQTV